MGANIVRGLLLVAVVGCVPSSGSSNAPPQAAAPAEPPPPGRTLIADAPNGFDPRVLGIPVDGNFRASPGVAPIFGSVGVGQIPVNTFSADQKLVTTGEELSANAQAWGVLDVGGGTTQHDRYAYFHATQMTTAWELQANGPMLQPPPWAVYYISKVYFGRSYIEVIKGDDHSFNARVAAHFLSIPIGGKVKSFVEGHRLSSHRAGSGFEPKGGDAIFARTQQEIELNYAQGTEVPIAVEYTQLPRTQANGAVIFPEPHAVNIRFVNVQVAKTGSMLADYSNWTMTGDCSIDGPPDDDLAEPKERLAPFLAERVRLGALPVSFTKTIYASDDETITCTTRGTYTRGLLGPYNLGPATAAIKVAAVVGTAQGMAPGMEAETAYNLAWTATKQ